MPSKYGRKKPEKKIEPKEEPQIVVEAPVSDESKPDPITEARERIFCGHQNMHYTEGVLKCTLEKGHQGNHTALLNNQWTEWSDSAGEPVK
jgi:hypothetical protein